MKNLKGNTVYTDLHCVILTIIKIHKKQLYLKEAKTKYKKPEAKLKRQHLRKEGDLIEYLLTHNPPQKITNISTEERQKTR